MKKTGISIVIGALSMSWLHPVYLYLFDHLYLSIALGPKVQYCRSIVDTDFCKLVAYIGLWVCELPLLIFAFITYYYLAVFIIRKYKLMLPSWYGVWLGYFLVFITLSIFSEYKFTIFGVLCGVYQALIGAGMLWVAVRLTRPSKIAR